MLMPIAIIGVVKNLMNGVNTAHITVFGLYYPGNSNNYIQGPTLEIIDLLITEGFRVSIYDPYEGSDKDESILENAVRDSDMILILADNPSFKSLDYDKLAKYMRTPLVLDTTNMINMGEYCCSEVIMYNLENACNAV